MVRETTFQHICLQTEKPELETLAVMILMVMLATKYNCLKKSGMNKTEIQDGFL